MTQKDFNEEVFTASNALAQAFTVINHLHMAEKIRLSDSKSQFTRLTEMTDTASAEAVRDTGISMREAQENATALNILKKQLKSLIEQLDDIERI